ncbi:hypothetical protein GLOIN_2v1880986 [Rhizophagus irregularis DAOM 181602=DAOM 197198]|uniref:Ion transport domain-containing protein n=1 Tax=Rhizophagus irregularis (strain DAOM 181602 / DAOM 197198 / MUCL 43194) TaxID=747089 RepID=A0A2P4PHP3_RHIID|nr:hypothetical protein GLOIN_2v1880986 [Rhizophagus irregularis DAOM 181602=DAOM 197198]POG64903.1 hypothetical protein GLOIN_2v1880986 [Rhizophagus irregularis DAOM 181602=DAOM 197198]|eukprot:XP_025171769.1 hypothetical protein GLOIN_2v1880986 [Rhizophagus irregularis DAOM 181602=DAOM 197198]
MDEYIKEAINKSIKKLDINELQQNKIDAKSSNFVKNLFKLVKNVLENNSVIITVVGGNAMEIKEFIGFLSSEEREIFTSIYEKDKENYSRSDEENEYNAIKLLIDYFICKWNKKVENLKFMYLVSNFLPYLVEKSYKIQMDELIPKLDYVEVPEVEFKSRKFSLANSTHKLSSTILTLNKFSSTRKNLWGYEFPTLNCKHSIFDRFEKEPQHYAIMCYVPLIGLCTYPERLNSFIKSDDGKNLAINLDKLLQIVWLASLSSNYDYSEPWDKNNFVRLCIFIFSIFTTIIVVNLLIAFVNDIYTQTSENSDIVLNFVRARQIAFVELVFMLPSERNNENYFPPTIIYEANADEAEKHNRKPKIPDK